MTDSHTPNRPRPPRQRTLLAARIFVEGRSSFDCVVRNISDSGALLTFESTIGVPNGFDLHVLKNGDVRHCDVAWRSADRIGVKFRA